MYYAYSHDGETFDAEKKSSGFSQARFFPFITKCQRHGIGSLPPLLIYAEIWQLLNDR